MAETLVELFEEQVQRLGVRTALQYFRDGEWEELTWKEWWDESERLAAGLIELGCKPGQRVGLMASTRREWVITDMAIAMAGAVSVTMDPAMTVRELMRAVEESGAQILVVEHPLHVSRLVELARQGQHIGGVVYLDGHLHTSIGGTVGGDLVRIEEVALPPQMDVQSVSETMQKGRRALSGQPRYVASRRRALESDREATVVYTSGVSDEPRGVVLTHANLVAQVKGLSTLKLFGDEERQLLVLPLAHIFARLMYLAAVGYGMTTSFGRGPKSLSDDLQAVKPTLVACVPKMVERLRGHIEERLEKKGVRGRWLKKALKKVGAADGEGTLEAVKRRSLTRWAEDDIRHWLGGRLDHLVCGGAPMKMEAHRFFQALGYVVLEGYGLAESAGGVSFNMPDDYRIGSVGKPLPGVDATIAEDGEILVRGPMVMKGYLGGEAEEPRGVDRDGWLHTGDIGEFDTDGFLYLKDRKAELVVTSTGRHVATDGLEKALTKHPMVAHAVVLGEGRPYLGALVSLEADELLDFIRAEKLDEGQPIEELTNHRRVREVIGEHFDGVNSKRNRRERIRYFRILPEFLSLQQRTLAPSGEVRRAAVIERFRNYVEELFEEGETA